MNKVQVLFLCALLFSCSSSLEKDRWQAAMIDSLRSENARLNTEIVRKAYDSTIQRYKPIPKYVFAIITYSKEELVPEQILPVPYGPPDRIPSHYITVKTSWFSPIQEFQIFNEDLKYEFMDEMEQKIPFALGKQEVLQRKCLTFDSYSEASKSREAQKRSHKAPLE